MAEDIHISKGTKEEQYRSLAPQIEALIAHEVDLVANLGNICAALKEQFNWLWVGFYMVNHDELVLSAFQGPVACTRIRKGRGVCGTAWQNGHTLIVDDVSQFEAHIACNSFAKSEIVIPVFQNEKIIAVLDADSEHLNHFDHEDKRGLGKIIDLIKF